jgi:transcriptional regulator with XRE-family HTH domain
MKKSIVEKLREKIKPENKIFIQKNLAISEQISYLLEQKGWSQKDLAEKMGKEPSEISKLVSGLHNITLMSIAKVEATLGEDIIITPIEAQKKYKKVTYVSLEAYANSNRLDSCEKVPGIVEYDKSVKNKIAS